MGNYFKTNYISVITIILGINLILFLFAFQNFIFSKNNQNNIIAHAQEALICPTGMDTQNSLQLLHCYINTPTPTIPVTPSPTITPAPTKAANNPSVTQADNSCSPPFADYSAAKLALSTKYKIDLQGDQDLAWASQAYTTMCQIYKSPLFVSLLSQNPITVIFSGNTCGNISAHADMFLGITISGMCNADLNRAVLVHELGHMIQFRSPNVFNNFLNAVWPSTIPTYNCQIHNNDGVTAPECFADGIAEYAVYPQYRIQFNGTPPGNANFAEYPTTFANYYNFFRDNVFGGITISNN